LTDLSSYRVVVHETPLENSNLPHNLTICGPPPPSSFAVTQSIIAVMGGKTTLFDDLEIWLILFAAFYSDAPEKQWLLDDPLMYHRLLEAMKFAYAQRTLLGDGDFVKIALELAKNMTTPEFTQWVKSQITGRAENMSHYGGEMLAVPEDHGTSHTSTIDTEGNAVSCTSTINR
jgi:gamma-glutamyltranspeptidase/glutathione hydrolase/leukotriene-C4 hydrolase